MCMCTAFLWLLDTECGDIAVALDQSPRRKSQKTSVFVITDVRNCFWVLTIPRDTVGFCSYGKDTREDAQTGVTSCLPQVTLTLKSLN